MLKICFSVLPPMTPAELLKLIDQAAAEQWEELDLAGMGLTELPPGIGRCDRATK
jgi:hypothetical protein